MAAKFEVYEDQAGAWRWKLFAANKSIIATSDEPFETKSAAESCVKAVKRDATEAKVKVTA